MDILHFTLYQFILNVQELYIILYNILVLLYNNIIDGNKSGLLDNF